MVYVTNVQTHHFLHIASNLLWHFLNYIKIPVYAHLRSYWYIPTCFCTSLPLHSSKLFRISWTPWSKLQEFSTTFVLFYIGATFPPTSWISPKKSLKHPKSETLGKTLGTLPTTTTFRFVPGRFQLVTLRYGRSYRSLTLGPGGPAGARCAPTAGGQRFVG